MLWSSFLVFKSRFVTVLRFLREIRFEIAIRVLTARCHHVYILLRAGKSSFNAEYFFVVNPPPPQVAKTSGFSFSLIQITEFY